MRKALLFLCAGLFVAGVLGCQTPAYRSVSQNTELTVIESMRVLGLDRPSTMHMRDNVPLNYYTPYR